MVFGAGTPHMEIRTVKSVAMPTSAQAYAICIRARQLSQVSLAVEMGNAPAENATVRPTTVALLVVPGLVTMMKTAIMVHVKLEMAHARARRDTRVKNAMLAFMATRRNRIQVP